MQRNKMKFGVVVAVNSSCLHLDLDLCSSFSFDVVSVSLCPMHMYMHGKGRHACKCVGKCLIAVCVCVCDTWEMTMARLSTLNCHQVLPLFTICSTAHQMISPTPSIGAMVLCGGRPE